MAVEHLYYLYFGGSCSNTDLNVTGNGMYFGDSFRMMCDAMIKKSEEIRKEPDKYKKSEVECANLIMDTINKPPYSGFNSRYDKLEAILHRIKDPDD